VVSTFSSLDDALPAPPQNLAVLNRTGTSPTVDDGPAPSGAIPALRPWQRALAWTEVFGGIFGCAGAVTELRVGWDGFVGWIYLVPAGLGLLSLSAGLLLLARSRLGLLLSLPIQAAQMLVLGAPLRLVYLAGPKLLVIVSQVGVLFSLGATATVQAAWPAPDGSLRGEGLDFGAFIGVMPHPLAQAAWTLGVNLVPLFFVVTLVRDRHQMLPRPRG
jgi:hypothetical protein